MVAIDQYGEHIYIRGKYPRKELMKKLGIKHVQKMYIDTKNGDTFHIGYIISGRWFSLYTEWKKPA